MLTTTCGTPGYMAPEIFKKTGHSKPVDIWALGVITYFLLCGYTPFDRDSDFEEMQAILKADYSFTPLEYWRGVSDDAKDFIRKCLTIDPAKRMTAHEALQHPFVAGPKGGDDKGQNLLPTVKKNFNARRTLHAAIDTVRAINKLREGHLGQGLMDGAKSKEPSRESSARKRRQRRVHGQQPGQGLGLRHPARAGPQRRRAHGRRAAAAAGLGARVPAAGQRGQQGHRDLQGALERRRRDPGAIECSRSTLSAERERWKTRFFLYFRVFSFVVPSGLAIYLDSETI